MKKCTKLQISPLPGGITILFGNNGTFGTQTLYSKFYFYAKKTNNAFANGGNLKKHYAK